MKSCVKFTMCALFAVFITGCCSEKDKERAANMIDKRIQQMHATCEKIEDQGIKDQCFADINPLISEMQNEYTKYRQACAEGKTKLAEEILDGIKDLVSSKVIVHSSGDVINDQFILFPDDLVWLDIAAEVDENEDVVPIDLIQVDGLRYLTEAIGNLSISRTDSSESTDTLDVEILRGDLDMNFEEGYAVEGPVSIEYSGISLNGTVAGELWLTPTVEVGDVARSVPTQMALTVTSNLLTFDLVLEESSPHNELLIGPDGSGTLRVVVNADYDSSNDLPPFLPDEIWLTIPVEASADLSTIQMTTGGQWLAGTDIVPVGPFPVADFNNDGVVNQADFDAFMDAFINLDPTADVNYDGVIDQNDLDYFLEFWQFEMEAYE